MSVSTIATQTTPAAELVIETNVVGAFEIVKDVFNSSARTNSLDRTRCQHCAKNKSREEASLMQNTEEEQLQLLNESGNAIFKI